MHRASESLGALAAALAKAQSELKNPDKSLVATIAGNRQGEGPRSFRYAPLSSGLDIIRKALGQQQIAIIQTTAVDLSSGTVNLTTVLAHASGEWIASDWPVCRIVDAASPHRIGAALTYARRYALFTLVGIAGEDDTDAPDLNGGPESDDSSGVTFIFAGVDNRSRRPPRSGKDRQDAILDSEASVALREQLIKEVAHLNSELDAAQWARAAVPRKNTLTASDARLVEVAFELRLPCFETEAHPPDAGLTRPGESQAAARSSLEPFGLGSAVRPGIANDASAAAQPRRPPGIDKSLLPIGEARRYRDKTHLKFVASRPCLVCGRQPCDPHHLRFAQLPTLGRKVSDEFTVPLCRLHHRELHRTGNEAQWWAKVGLDALGIARQLWKATRANSLPSTSAMPEHGATGRSRNRRGGRASDTGVDPL